MEKQKITTVGNYDISFVNEDYEKTKIGNLLSVNNSSLSSWSALSIENTIIQFNIKAYNLFKIIKDFNSSDIYGQANLEKGCTLALEHLLDLIESTNIKVNQQLEKQEDERKAKEKVTREIEKFVTTKVIPEAEKLKGLLEELEKKNSINLNIRSIYNPNDYQILEQYFRYRLH